jgi:hypothetical protein
MERSAEPRHPSQPDSPTSIEEDRLVEREDEGENSAPTMNGPTGLDAIDEDLTRMDRRPVDPGDDSQTTTTGPTGLDAIDEDLARKD